MEELQLEEKLIRAGSHPEYLQQLAEIESRKDQRLRETSDRLRLATRVCGATFDAGVKLGAKRDLRWSMFDQCIHDRFQLLAEFEQSSMRSPPGGFIGVARIPTACALG
nr:hypothetical protein HK105_002099 [Polyrhizophydium stewartii]